MKSSFVWVVPVTVSGTKEVSFLGLFFPVGCVLARGQATSEGGLAWCSVLPSEADSVTAELPAMNTVLRMERKNYRHRLCK